MALTNRHFHATAKLLRDARDTDSPDVVLVVERIARALADLFADENPRFDTDRFLRAAGVGATPVDGIIHEPGIFEGEPVWASYYYNLANHGEGETHVICNCTEQQVEAGLCDCPTWERFTVSGFDRTRFPSLAHVDNVWVTTDSQGFLIALTDKTDNDIRAWHGLPPV